jgi:hypothetical protein
MKKIRMNLWKVSQLPPLLFNRFEPRRSSGDLVRLKATHDFGNGDNGDARCVARMLAPERQPNILITRSRKLQMSPAVPASSLFPEDELQDVEMSEEEHGLAIWKPDYTG